MITHDIQTLCIARHLLHMRAGGSYTMEDIPSDFGSETSVRRDSIFNLRLSVSKRASLPPSSENTKLLSRIVSDAESSDESNVKFSPNTFEEKKKVQILMLTVLFVILGVVFLLIKLALIFYYSSL